MKTELPLRPRPLAVTLVALGLALLVLACVTESWIALRAPLWGDELDTIAPAFRPWHGDKDFWWLLGQYNANPPGDNLVLRWWHQADLVPWLRATSPELFWRLPYLLVFAATLCSAAFGAWRYTGNLFMAFAVLAATAVSPGLLDYGNVVRFYITLSLFVTLLAWAFLLLGDGKNLARWWLFSALAALGVCFHLVIAGVAYFWLFYAIAWLAREFWQVRALSRKRLVDAFIRLLGGAAAFIVYKVELKHWIFVPHAWSKDSPWARLWERGITPAITSHISENLPFDVQPGLVYTVILLLLARLAWNVHCRRPEECARSGFLLTLLAASPVALFISAALRNYDMSARHFVFEAPVLICACVYLARPLLDRLRDVPWKKFGALPTLVTAGVALTLFANAAGRLSAFAASRSNVWPPRVTYPLVEWRHLYRVLPDRRELVIVGSQPDTLSATSDQEEYRAGIMRFYTEEFLPVFYSVKGSFARDASPDAKLGARIERETARFDLLVLDDFERARKLFPRLPWARLHCRSFQGDRPLSFCRL